MINMDDEDVLKSFQIKLQAPQKLTVSRLDPSWSPMMQILLDILKKDPISLDHVQVLVVHDTKGEANTGILIGPHHL